MKVYDGKVYGIKVSDYGLEKGYLDFKALAGIVGDCILNNDIYEYVGYDNWCLESGCDYDEEDYYEVLQFYIITASGAEFLRQFTDEIIYYNETLDMYLWGVTHLGTSWDYVLTDIELEVE